MQGHLVRDPDDNEFGIIDFNPDLADPAVLLMARQGSAPEGTQRICRPGSSVSVGRRHYTVTAVHTDQSVYVDLAENDPVPGDAPQDNAS